MIIAFIVISEEPKSSVWHYNTDPLKDLGSLKS